MLRREAAGKETLPMLLENWISLPLVDAVREIAADDPDYTVTKMFLPRGRGPAPHHHPHKQVVVILEGSGVMLLGDMQVEFSAGSVIPVPPEVPHTMLYTAEDSRWLEFFTPGREDWR